MLTPFLFCSLASPCDLLKTGSCAKWRQVEPFGLACIVILTMYPLVNVMPDSHSQARRHRYRGAALINTFHMIASDVLLQGNRIFWSVITVLLFLTYFIVKFFYFSVVLVFFIVVNSKPFQY